MSRKLGFVASTQLGPQGIEAYGDLSVSLWACHGLASTIAGVEFSSTERPQKKAGDSPLNDLVSIIAITVPLPCRSPPSVKIPA
jgi:hypothetical protein